MSEDLNLSAFCTQHFQRGTSSFVAEEEKRRADQAKEDEKRRCDDLQKEFARLAEERRMNEVRLEREYLKKYDDAFRAEEKRKYEEEKRKYEEEKEREKQKLKIEHERRLAEASAISRSQEERDDQEIMAFLKKKGL